MSQDLFKAYAVMEPKGPCVEWQYEPKTLLDNDVEIEISHCGICHSDIHTLDCDWGQAMFPLIVGHEIVGVVRKAGQSSKFKVGERVGVGAQVYSCQDFASCKSCRYDNDQHCPKITFTYNSKYPDGSMAYGGYQHRVRCDSSHVFRIPATLPSDAAAPLMCAGATVFSPLSRWGAGTLRKRVGVIGLGGLGHFAVQFAAAMGAEVTVLSTSQNKENDAKLLGAKKFVVTTDEQQVAAAANSLDLIINTVSSELNLHTYFTMMDLDAVFVQVGAPAAPLPVSAFDVLFKRIIFTGSLIGSIKELEATLEFAAKHNVVAWINKLPMSQVNEGLKMVRENKPRFRVVLENETFEKN